MQHLVRADRARDRRRRTSSTYAGRLGFGAPHPVRPADRAVAGDQRRRRRAGRLRRRRRAGERGVRPGRDVRDAAPDGARRGDGRERRRADAAAPRDGASPARTGTREIGPRALGRVIDAARRRRHQPRRWSQAVEGDLGQRFTAGAKVPGVTTAGKSGTAELGGTRRAALVVHRLRAGRGTDGRDRGPRRAGAAGAAEVAAPIAGDLMALLPRASDGDEPGRDDAPGREPPPTGRRPSDRATTRARSSSASGWPPSPPSWRSLFGGVAVAAWVGGEPFLAVMGAHRLPDDGLGRRPDAVPRLTARARTIRPRADASATTVKMRGSTAEPCNDGSRRTMPPTPPTPDRDSSRPDTAPTLRPRRHPRTAIRERGR